MSKTVFVCLFKSILWWREPQHIFYVIDPGIFDEHVIEVLQLISKVDI